MITGWIKVKVSGKLKFKKTPNSEIQTFNSTEVLACKWENIEFKSVKNIEAFGKLGIKNKVKSCFAEVVDKGKIDLLKVYRGKYGSSASAKIGYNKDYSKTNPLKRNPHIYTTLLLLKPDGSQISLPLNRKSFSNKIKNQMKIFFEDDKTYWLPKINSISKKNGGFFQVINMVKEYNKR